MAKHLQRDLGDLKKELLASGSLVEEALNHAIEALVNRRINLAEVVIDGDYQINQKENQIEDDSFTLKRIHAVSVCEEILRRKIKIHWSLPNGVRIDKLDPELLRLMKKSGCYYIALGIESANQRILDMIKKRLDKNVVRKVVTMVNDSGIEGVGFFMIGLPTETREEIMETINFACSLDLK